MASKSIPSVDQNTDNVDAHKAALDQVRPGLTQAVPDPAAVPDSANAGAWKMFDEQSDYVNKYSGGES